MILKDIVKAEANNNNNIILLRQGIFWKAYEKSAYAFCKHIKPFMVKKKYFKSVNDEIVSIGFPISSTRNILKGRTVLLEEEKKMIVSIDEIDHEEFLNWKKAQTLTAVSPAAATMPTNGFERVGYNGSREMSGYGNPEKEVITRIKMLNLESKTPFECMFFLAEIKKQLS